MFIQIISFCKYFMIEIDLLDRVNDSKINHQRDEFLKSQLVLNHSCFLQCFAKKEQAKQIVPELGPILFAQVALVWVIGL